MCGRIPVVIDRRPAAIAATSLSLPPTVHGALWRGLWPFRLPCECAILTACPNRAPIAEAFVAGASESVRRRQVFMTTPASFSSALAGLRSTTLRRGRSRMIGLSAYRSRTPRWTCSRPGSATSSTSCSGNADDQIRRHLP